MKQITTPKLVQRNYTSKLGSGLQRIFLFPSSLCFVLTIFFTSPLFIERVLAQSNVKIEGYVYDQESGHPLSGAQVRIANSSYRTVSNSSGFFFFEKLPTGSYSLEIHCSAYQKEIVSDVEVIEDVTRKINIYLRRRIYELAPIEVTAKRMPLPSGSVEIIDKEKIRNLRVNSVAEVLEGLAGVYVQKTGRTAGQHQISIRGSSSEHVLVLIDGQRINPSGSGKADLTSIPLEMVEKIEVYKGGASSRYGSGALAGAVNIVTHPQTVSNDTKIQAKNYLGSWDSDVFSFSLKNPVRITNSTTNLAYTYGTSDGDFEYDDPKNGLSKRENAHQRRYDFFFSGLAQLKPRSGVAFSAQLYRSKNGIPGAVYQLTKNAHLNDSRRFLNFKFEQELSRKVSGQVRFGLLCFEQHYKSTQDKIKYDTEYVDDIVDFSTGLRFRLLPENSMELGAEFEKDILHHKDHLRPAQSMGKITRQTFSLFFTEAQAVTLPPYLFFNDLNLNLSVRHDRPEKVQDFTSPQVGITLSRGAASKIILRSSYGKSYRQPSNNALFWKEDVWSAGNPDLLPEKSENYELGTETGLPFLAGCNLSAGITYFHSLVWDIIVWRRRFDGRHMPVNISKAEISGHEDFARLSLFDGKIEVNYQNTVAQVLNRSGDRIYDGKFIPFRPRYVTNLEYRLTGWLLRFSHRFRWVSERYTLEANTKKEQPYHLEDLSLGVRKMVSNWEVKFNVQVKNLTSEKYVLIQNHPMPGRDWGVNLEVTHDIEK